MPIFFCICLFLSKCHFQSGSVYYSLANVEQFCKLSQLIFCVQIISSFKEYKFRIASVIFTLLKASTIFTLIKASMIFTLLKASTIFTLIKASLFTRKCVSSCCASSPLTAAASKASCFARNFVNLLSC